MYLIFSGLFSKLIFMPSQTDITIKHRYFAINKPINMVSQFVSPHKVGLLGNLDFNFPPGSHAIGRLDSNSEGLLLLSTNKKITSLLFTGKISHERVYLVQVNNKLTENSLQQLRRGVPIRVDGGETYITPECQVEIVEHPESIYPHIHVANEYGVHTWLLIKLYEGKYRQVRKMISSVYHRCKRLIRVSIEDLQLGNLKPGCVREIEEKDFFEKLKLNNEKSTQTA